ncbi:unnamed protein product [Blepharisma stoltei]|uniref:Uncharacterized protein n=1 Tax=Blepharisma stoltei TaxID=1481888 RepID=A0AAU9K6W9_9CILI|nr:unnamed protein product [Blepharisma stoltei]
MIVEISVSLLGTALTFPAFIQEYNDIGESDKWYSYIKLLPHFLLILACGFRFGIKFMKIFQIPCISLSAVTWASLYYLFLFNLTASTTAVCEKYTDACAEDLDGLSLCLNNPVKGWEGIMYLIGLSMMVIGSTLLTKEIGFQLYEGRKSKVES